MPAIRDDWFEAERFIRAAGEGDIAEMSRLASSGYDANLMDELSRSALHYAATEGQYLAATWLLQHGAEVNLHDEEMIGETALCLAVQLDYPEMVELLLQHGADPDISGWMQLTARIRAHRRKDEDGRKIAALIELYRPPAPNRGQGRGI
jgi:ankyrin repeat protein